MTVQLPPTTNTFNARAKNNFVKWLRAGGAEIQKPHDWEVLRVRTEDGVHILYYNARQHLTWTGDLPRFYRAFRAGGSISFFPSTPRTRDRGKSGKSRTNRVKSLRERDGSECFFCGEDITGEETIEELCPRTCGGPTHLANQTLACEPCNMEAGNMSVADKVRLRDEKRGHR